MGKRVRVLTGVIVVAIYIFNPLSIRTSMLVFVSSLTTFANLAPVVEPDSLKAAISNVTADFDQLTNILQDFFDRLPENTTETLFRDFLTSKASRRHKDLERYLDWVLGFYRFAWPFLIVYIILRLSSSAAKPDAYDGKKSSDRGRKARRRSVEYSEEGLPRNGQTEDVNPSTHSRPVRSTSAQSFG